MKLCKNCKHHSRRVGEHYCTLNEKEYTCVITGKSIFVGVEACFVARSQAPGQCGPEGKFYVEKEKPFWKF